MTPNIHLEKINASTFAMHLPCEKTLELHPLPAIGTCDDIVMRWPLNPHFTGFNGIASMLQAMPQFAGCNFVKGENCDDF